MRIAVVFVVAFACSLAFAQGVPDCTIGHLEIGGSAPQYKSAEYSRGRGSESEWLFFPNAKHWRSLVKYGSVPYEQFIEIRDDKIVGIVREFTTDRTRDVVNALRARYGEPVRPHAALEDWDGWASETGQLTFFDAACGLRIDAFPSVDPGDADERSIVVWTKGVDTPTPAELDAIR